jgi:ATP-dependent Lon protease
MRRITRNISQFCCNRYFTSYAEFETYKKDFGNYQKSLVAKDIKDILNQIEKFDPLVYENYESMVDKHDSVGSKLQKALYGSDKESEEILAELDCTIEELTKKSSDLWEKRKKIYFLQEEMKDLKKELEIWSTIHDEHTAHMSSYDDEIVELIRNKIKLDKKIENLKYLRGKEIAIFSGL